MAELTFREWPFDHLPPYGGSYVGFPVSANMARQLQVNAEQVSETSLIANGWTSNLPSPTISAWNSFGGVSLYLPANFVSSRGTTFVFTVRCRCTGGTGTFRMAVGAATIDSDSATADNYVQFTLRQDETPDAITTVEFSVYPGGGVTAAQVDWTDQSLGSNYIRAAGSVRPTNAGEIVT